MGLAIRIGLTNMDDGHLAMLIDRLNKTVYAHLVDAYICIASIAVMTKQGGGESAVEVVHFDARPE